MGAIFIGRGDCRPGMRRTDAEGNVAEQTGAKWEPSAEGGCVAICDMDSDKMEPIGAAEVFGDWDADHFLARVLEKLGPGRPANVPDFRTILTGYVNDTGERDIFCEYCDRRGCACRDCIVTEWMEEMDEAQ